MKVLIVDDEAIFRTGLARAIPWEELGFALLQPAGSAEEALMRLTVERPDLMLADVHMAGINGPSLADEAKRLLPGLEVIFLTGREPHAAARGAPGQPVSDWLPKTSTPENIIRTVMAAKRRMEKRRRADSLPSKPMDDAKTRQLIGWIAEGMAEMADRSLLPGDGPWQVLVAAAGGWGTTDRERALLRYAVRCAIRELLPGESFEYGETIVLIQPASRSDHDSAMRRQAARRLEEWLGCRLDLVGGEPVIRPERMHRSYLIARDTLAYRQMMRDGMRENAGIAGGKSICSAEEERQVIRLLMANKPDELKRWTGAYVRRFMQDPETTPGTLTAALQSVAMAAYRWLERAERAGGLTEPVPRLAVCRPPDGGEQDHAEALYACLAAVMERHHRNLPENLAEMAERDTMDGT
jgi:two-component system response regulator YesN